MNKVESLMLEFKNNNLKKPAYFLIFIFSILWFGSCSEEYIVKEGVSGIYIVTDANTKIIGQELIIEVKTDSGEDITDQSVIYANGEVLSSPSYVAEEVGVVNLRAEYLNVDSDEVAVEYHDGSQTNFKKRVLVEDYTGTWCGWCPRISHALDLVDQQTDEAVFVAIHRAPAGTQDPYIYEDADELELLIETPGYPKGFINRLTQWDFPEPDNVGQVISFTQGVNPKLGLKMSSSIDNNQINLSVRALFAEDFQNLKLVVYLLENGLVYPQVNYTSFFNGENPIEDYVHDHTLRKTLTNILGDEIDNAQTSTGNTYLKEYNFQVPQEVENIDNIEFVAFLTDDEGNVINVRKSALGEVQDFEFL